MLRLGIQSVCGRDPGVAKQTIVHANSLMSSRSAPKSVARGFVPASHSRSHAKTCGWKKKPKQCRKCEAWKTLDCYPAETQSLVVKRRRMYNVLHLCTQCIEDGKVDIQCRKCEQWKPLESYPSHTRNAVAQTGRIQNRKHTCAE
jgi:hypothetical protein